MTRIKANSNGCDRHGVIATPPTKQGLLQFRNLGLLACGLVKTDVDVKLAQFGSAERNDKNLCLWR